MKKNPKTIQIIGKQWFDKINGNSYFSTRVFFDNILVLLLPFQYGYGDQYIYASFEKIKKEKLIKDVDVSVTLWELCEKNNITYLATLHKNCKKSEVKTFGGKDE